MTATFSIPQAYGWNILAATAIATQVVVIGGLYAAAARKKYGVKYPDMGSGRHSAALTDAQWNDFNNHQRAHQNYVEGVATGITLQLLAGLFYPIPAAVAGLVYIVGRQVYARGYVSQGPQGRGIGAGLFHLGELAEFGMIVYGAVRLLGFL